MPNEAPDSEVLIFNEADLIPAYYKPYIKSKRVAFAANASEQLQHWKLYLAIDESWARGLEDCKVGGGSDRGIPMMLFMTAHAKMRVGMELAFMGCMGEARSIMRDGIEFTAHAHRLHAHPEVQTLWYSKAEREKEWKAEFWDNKRTMLFDGLPELHQHWNRYSDVGSHANLKAISTSLGIERNEQMMTMTYEYHGGEKGAIFVLGLHNLLLTCALMENAFYADMRVRLQFDDTLLRMRQDADQKRLTLRETIIKKYGQSLGDNNK